MKLTIDTVEKTLTRQDGAESRTIPLYSKQAFEWLSREWLRVGWEEKYSYTFTWIDRPIIQLPEDMFRIQEVICRLQPDVIVETGIAHGGSLIFYSSLCKMLGKGRVIGVDVEIRPHNRKAIEAHPLFPYITLVEGDSTAAAIVERVRGQLHPGETVLVVLDSCHTREHVGKELEAYAPLVTPGSYIVVADGVMADLADVPHGNPKWKSDNPGAAAREFLAQHAEFVLDPPAWRFNESPLDEAITYWPDAWLRRK